MSLDSVHPDYLSKKDGWTVMRDVYRGEEAVKEKRTTYLPPSKGMLIDGMKAGEIGLETYEAYLTRAVFPEYTTDAVQAYIGLLHQKPANIQLPQQMEFMREKATAQGESLLALLRRINEEQLVSGRVGLLLDMPAPVANMSTSPQPYISMYIAESIRNWDEGKIEEGKPNLNLVVLDESGNRRNSDFGWEAITKYRVLKLGALAENEGEGGGTYMNGAFEAAGAGATPVYVESDMTTPVMMGQSLNEIPFVFVNTKDITAEPDSPPLMGLARLCLAIYRGEADYRQNLFMQGQDTFVTIGDFKRPKRDLNDISEKDDEPIRTGAGSHVSLEQGGDAKYVGVNSQGLPEQRMALAADRNRAETRSGQLIRGKNGDAESGEALKTRVAAQTATLNQIAITGAAALEHMLRMCARWMGLDEKAVTVTPNLEFADFEMTGQNLMALMEARAMGAPLTKRSIHGLMVDQGLTKMDYESEVALYKVEIAQDVKDGLIPTAVKEPAKPAAK
jgi:hypothetical protein